MDNSGRNGETEHALCGSNGAHGDEARIGYGSSSEYMRELIRRDRDRVQFRQYLLDGVESKPAGRMDAAYFAALRKKLKSTSSKKKA